ncbi:hypothetical protein DICPUDRAFT_42617 [Dictyostelium purpureum]|uniref:Ketosynthase family 3 (KS3) domain-containing protein n=1 Tax=Dictyostelium purpureum TaxID=5786 RepID=F1A2G3_DICPU|nr:uncharacterized protein DICPUDRAFT_42617 [Dictyostelium purpureum]EGC29619.1 hypothetical protein DICPUDRAFT_42617 [Dictyostelium purpureum]|eukprot:XP_003293852.1 hypothetical protein DICPUDRAFT_42617 [Dictyostelium purpureum]
MQTCDVAIIGIGIKLPKCNNQEDFWNILINKQNCSVSLSERFKKFDINYMENDNYVASLVEDMEWDNFDSNQFNLDSNIVSFLDPQLKQLLVCASNAINDANLNKEIKGSKTSCYIGSTSNEYQSFLRINKKLNYIVGSSSYSLSNMISYVFDLRGSSITINSACSSSLNCISLGYDSIVNGNSELSICGASNYIFDPEYHKSYIGMGVISKNHESRSYNENAHGFVRGEGTGIVILKKLEHAIRDKNKIYSVIKGANSNSDGALNKAKLVFPSKESQRDNILKALLKSNLSPNQIDYFEANAPGLSFLDHVESEAISMVFDSNNQNNRTSPLLFGTYKPNMGHLEGASGIGGIIKCCLIFKYKCFPPTLTFEGNMNPNIKLFHDESKFKLVTEKTNFNKENVNIVLNNFGATGSNGCVVLSNYN